MTMNDSLLELIGKDVVEIKEGYAKSTDKADMNSKINNYLVEQVKSKKMTIDQALQESFFKIQLVEFLRQHGFAKAVQDIDVSRIQEREEAEEAKIE